MGGWTFDLRGPRKVSQKDLVSTACSDIHTQTLKFRFLYVTDSTLKPIVGIVVTTSPILSLYKSVVLPALSSPRINIRISFLAHTKRDNVER